MAVTPITSGSFGADPNIFPAVVYPQLISAITSANPFADSLARYDSGNTRAVFGVVEGFSGAAWINEADPKPDISADTTSYVAIAQELAGIPLISERAIRDTNVDLLGEVQRVLKLYFGKMLDDGLLHGDTPPEPVGVMTVAAAASGATLWEAVNEAKASIIGAGGAPSTLALPPTAVAVEEGQLDGDGRPLYPDGIDRYAGLDVVRVPAMAAAEGLVYDARQTYLVVAEDFRITPSREYAVAYQRDSVALRTSGQFTAAVPVPSAAIRKLTVTP